MALNIKNEKTHQMARELAALQGVSIVVAVTNALEEKLRKESTEYQKKSSRTGFADWLMELSKETAPLMNDGRTSKEIMDELFDENGLPV